MSGATGFIVALGAAYAVAISALLILRAMTRPNVLIAWSLAGPVMACPLIIPPDHVLLRGLVYFPCLDIWLKLTDLSRIKRLVTPISLRQCLLFLIPFPFLLVVYVQRRRMAQYQLNGSDIARIVVGGLMAILLFLVVIALTQVQSLQSSFPRDHLTKLVLFVLAVESISQFTFGLERVFGYDTTPIVRFAFLSRTVGEFWRRYNTRVESWMYYNVFLPAGGIRNPTRGILLTFFASAVLHELAFDVATSRVDGYQFAFFMLQAPAVLASHWFDRKTRAWPMTAAILNRILTIIWFAASSILFFHGVDRVIPLYYASKPWLP